MANISNSLKLLRRTESGCRGEYRTYLAIVEQVVGKYSFNNNINMRSNETIKDSVDPKGRFGSRKERRVAEEV